MSYVKVPVQLFDYNLTANELKVFIYLFSIKNQNNRATVRIRTMQNRLAISSHATIQTALKGLEAKGLLSRRLRQDCSGRKLSSSYQLRTLSGAWFFLDISTQLWQLSKSAFAVYVHLIRICRQNAHAWPSYKAIADALRLAKRTIITAMKELIERGFVEKAVLWKGKHNLYTLFGTGYSNSEKKEKAATSTPLRPSHNRWKYRPISNFILHTWTVHVNHTAFLSAKGWCKNYLSPTVYRFILNNKERKSNIYVSLYPLVGLHLHLDQQCGTVYCAHFYLQQSTPALLNVPSWQRPP